MLVMYMAMSTPAHDCFPGRLYVRMLVSRRVSSAWWCLLISVRLVRFHVLCSLDNTVCLPECLMQQSQMHSTAPGPSTPRFHHRRRRVLLHYHSQRRQHPPNNNSLQQEETLPVPDEAALRRSRSLHTGGDMSWRPHRLSREQESTTTTHNRESSPLLRHECAHKQAMQQPAGGGHLARHHLIGSRRSVHTNSLQHYPSVGYAANRPEFNLR